MRTPTPLLSLSSCGTPTISNISNVEGSEDGQRIAYNCSSVGESSSEDQSSYYTESSGTTSSSSIQSVQSQTKKAYDDVNVFLTQGKLNQTFERTKKPAPLVEPAILKCCKEGDLVAIKKLVAEGYDVDETDTNERTALHVAGSLGRVEITKFLVNSGANVDACSAAGKTPLHEACMNGRYEILQELMAAVLDLDMVDTSGLSAAHYCTLNGEEKCLSLLCNQVE